MFKKYPFHPFLVGLFPVLFILAVNPGQVNWVDMLLPLIIIELATGLLMLIAYWISRNWIISSIYVSTLLAWFFSYGCFYNLFIGLTLNNAVIVRERCLIPIWGIILIIVFLCLAKYHRKPELNKALNVIISVFLLALLLKAELYYCKFYGAGRNIARKAWTKTRRSISENLGKGKPSYFPSIYYIILDSYSSNSSLKNIYGYDNEHFASYLRVKGFYIAENSCSNYASTGLSLPSSLNLDYLDGVYNLSNRDKKEGLNVLHMVEHSEIVEYLSGKGYKIFNFGSWWSPAAIQKGKAELSSYAATEFNIVLLKMTILRPIVEQLMSPLLRQGVFDVLNKTAELAKKNKPFFVFSHIICPHPPFIFGANGENVGLIKSLAMRMNPENLYLDQVKYINKRMELLINKILLESKSPPIIILQADHGSGFIFRPMHNQNIPGNSERDLRFLKAQFRILNAYYLPAGGEKYLYNSISPVNTFRLILNTYFGEHLDYLPDRSYYSSHLNPYDFMEVTDRLKD